MKYNSLLKLASFLVVTLSLQAQSLMAQYESPIINDCSYLNCNNNCESKFFMNAAFTYWRAEQEGLDVATSGILTTNGIGGFAVSPSPHSRTYEQNFDYAPGFKIGMGANIDSNWCAKADFTWYRNTTHQSKYAPGNSELGANVWVLDNWFLLDDVLGRPVFSDYVSSKWTINVNILDVTAMYKCYESCGFSFAPYFGIRAAWIDQKFNVSINQGINLLGNSSDSSSSSYSNDSNYFGSIRSRNKSQSWGVGPRLGMNMCVKLGSAFRIEGDIAASILYTEYSELKHKGEFSLLGLDVNSSDLSFNIHSKNRSFLRPNLDMKLGLGWTGCCGGYNIDVLASYDFMIFWHQNMMRQLVDHAKLGSGSSPANLNLHGLTLNVLVSF